MTDNDLSAVELDLLKRIAHGHPSRMKTVHLRHGLERPLFVSSLFVAFDFIDKSIPIIMELHAPQRESGGFLPTLTG
jgi:hypothetical protein